MTGASSPNLPRKTEPVAYDAPALPRGADGGSPWARFRTASPQARFAILAGVLLALGLAVRVAYVLHTSTYVPRHDAHSYDVLATAIAQGHGWVYGPTAYIAPGYPFYLAAIYNLIGVPHGMWTDVRLVQALVATVTIALIGWMALQLAGRGVALIALAIAAFYVPLVLVGVSLITESLFVPLLLAATNCALRARVAERRYWWIAAAGVFAGLASLTRGNGLILVPALALVVWTGRPRFSRQALGAPVILLIVAALAIAPWTIRNAIVEHEFVPVTTEAGLTLAGTYNDHAASTRFIWQFSYRNYSAIKRNKRLNDAQRDTQLISAVAGYVGRHPEYVPEAMFWNTLRLLDLQGRRVSRQTARNDLRASPRWADLSVVCFWIVGALALIALFTRGARSLPRVIWVIPLLLYLSIAPVTTGTPRFRAALDPFVILLAAVAIRSVSVALRERRAARRRSHDWAVAAVNG